MKIAAAQARARAGAPGAHPARIYNYWLGGKDNYEADRQAAEQAMAVTPDILPRVRANRAFLRRAVEFVAGQGIRRSTTDIGDGATRVASKINPRMGPTRLTPRPRAQIAAYFDGPDLVEPGLVGMPEWRGEANPHVVINAFAGVARKP